MEKDRFETYFGAATLSYKPSKKTEFALQASGFFTNELVSYDISGEYWLDQAGAGDADNGGVGGELGVGRYHEHARNRFKASVVDIALKGATGIRGHNLNYGLGFKHETVFDRAREWELRDSAGFSLPADPDAVRVIYNLSSRNDLASNRFSAFVRDSYRFESSAGFFNIDAGVRFSYWDYNKEFLVSPRASVGFVPQSMPGLHCASPQGFIIRLRSLRNCVFRIPMPRATR